MLNLMIVDDNNRDRRILQQILDWNSYGIHISAIAADGQEALEIARKDAPDIIITDISMPKLNGIELAREVNKLSPATKLIFISCYSDFEYARQAVNLNAFGYITKPLNQEELADIARRVAEACRFQADREQWAAEMRKQLRNTLPLAQEEFFREIMLGRGHEPEYLQDSIRYLTIPLEKAACIQLACIRFSQNTIPDPEKKIEQEYCIGYDLRELAQRLCPAGITVFWVRVSPVEYAALIFFDASIPGKECEDHTLELASKLHAYYTEQYNLEITVGISNTTVSFQDVHLLYRQSVEALDSKFYTLGLPVLLYREIRGVAKPMPDNQFGVEHSEELRELIFAGSIVDTDRFVDHYFGFAGHSLSEAYYKQCAISTVGQLYVLMLEQSFPGTEALGGDSPVFERVNSFPTLLELNLWLKGRFRAVISIVQEENASRNSKIVSSIKKEVQLHYAEQVTAESLAESVYLSAKQANNIFRKETGRTIFDYLVEYRIEVAKKLLRDPSNRIYWIAEQVGYLNKSHFALVFKKMTGMAPIDYRNQPL